MKSVSLDLVNPDPLTDSEMERLLEIIPKLLDWITENPADHCIVRRLKFVQFAFSEKNQGESFASFAKRTGESIQSLHARKMNFSKHFHFYFSGSYATKKKKIRIS